MNPHLGRRVEPLTGGWQPGDVGLCSFSVDDENSAAPSSGGGPGGESYVSLFLLPTFSKKEQFTFPPGSQVHWTTVCDALLPHSRPQPILPAAKRVWFRDTVRAIFCTIQPYSPSLQHQRYVDWEVGEAWTASGGIVLTRTIRLGYAIQFARRPPKFNGVLETSVAVWNAPVLREEIAVLLAKDAIELVPPAEIRQGFHSPYFIVP